MYDMTQIITRTSHDSSMSKVSKCDVPSAVIKNITYEFLISIANVLSNITKEVFIYTGKIVVEDQSLKISFVSSSQIDTIDMIIEYQNNGGYRFINLNDKLNKVIDINPSIQESIDQSTITTPDEEILPEAILPDPIKESVIPKKKKKKKSPVSDIHSSIDVMFNTIDKLESKVEVTKKVGMLEKLLNNISATPDPVEDIVPIISTSKELEKTSKIINDLIEKSNPPITSEFSKQSKLLEKFLEINNA